MPAAGTTKIPKTTKAKIIAEKRLKMVKPRDIAKQRGLAVGTVYNIVANTKDPEILAEADKIERRIIKQSQINVEKVLEAIGQRVSSPLEPLTGIVSAGKFSHDVYRLETNQPTTINQNNKAPIEYALEFARTLLADHKPAIAKQIFQRAKTVQIGVQASDEEWIEAEARVFDGD